MSRHTVSRLEYTVEDNRFWVSHPDMSNGQNSIDKANIKYLEKREIEWEEFRAEGDRYAKLWFPIPAEEKGTTEIEKLLESLEDYPLFSDDCHSEVEQEEENEAWVSWIRRKLVKDLPECLEKLQDREDHEELLMEAYHYAKGEANEYGHCESDGFYIDTEEIQEEFTNFLYRHLWAMNAAPVVAKFLKQASMPVPEGMVGALMLADLMEKQSLRLFVMAYWQELFQFLRLSEDNSHLVNCEVIKEYK